jgi:hypothetical protein
LVRSAFRPYAPAMTMDDALDDRQADPCPLKFVTAVETLKHTEHFIMVRHIEADPIIDDIIDKLFLFSRNRDIL